MSSIEYSYLFIKSQNNKDSKYHMFIFDIVGSSNMCGEELNEAEMILKDIIIDVYNIIFEKEILFKRKILVFEKDFVKFENLNRVAMHEFGLKSEPFKFGDMVGFTIYRDSLLKEEVITIFDMIKENYNYKYELHYADGYYETNDYVEGNTKLFRGYCMDILSNKHKVNYIKRLRKV